MHYVSFTSMNYSYYHHHPKELFGCLSSEVILGYKFQSHTPIIRSTRMEEGGFHCPFSAQCFLMA